MPKDPQLVFEGPVYVLRTGCQWKALPSERYGRVSAIHARFLEWEKTGVFDALWKQGLPEYDEFEGIAWRWQNIDVAIMKAPLTQKSAGPNPTDHGKNGSKHYFLVAWAVFAGRRLMPTKTRAFIEMLHAALDDGGQDA